MLKTMNVYAALEEPRSTKGVRGLERQMQLSLIKDFPRDYRWVEVITERDWTEGDGKCAWVMTEGPWVSGQGNVQGISAGGDSGMNR